MVRKLEAAIDLSFIYDEVKGLYKNYGRESIDPVVLIKIAMLQYLFGIRSMRQTIKEIEVNFAYRWYIGYGLNEEIPHFSTFGKNYVRRFKDTDLFEIIFARILSEIEKCGFINDENIFIDGTHIKASANTHNYKKELIEETERYYEKELQEAITQDRKNHDKKPLKDKDKNPTYKEVKSSTVDPDCGLFHKGEHKKVFAYASNTVCDRNNYILGFEVTAGNVNDSTSFPRLYEKVILERPEVKRIVADAGYRTPAIAKQVLDDNKQFLTAYKRPMTKDGFFKKYEYVYDEFYDCYICPNNKILKYSTTNRDGYREYKSKSSDCDNCEFLKKCTESKDTTKVVNRHVWENYMEDVEEIRLTIGSKEIYALRKETIERVFADGKEKHGMRYTQYRGIDKVKMELTLLFACMNLKKFATWLDRLRRKPKGNSHYCTIILDFLKKITNDLFLLIEIGRLSTV